MKIILGQKLEMTQKFKEDGTLIPVTVVKTGQCFITQVKGKDKDGYKALQIGFGEKKKLNKALAGHLKGTAKVRYLKELRLEDGDETAYEKGQVINAAIFSPGEKIKVSGISKGKGFQGVVRRHGFHGAPKSHGHKDQLRRSGAIGAGGPQHVFKGMRMAGRMGGGNVSVTNLEVIEIDNDKNLIYIKGAIPGSRNGLVVITAPGEMKLSSKADKSKEAKPEDAKPADEVKNETSEATAPIEIKSEEKAAVSQ